MRMTRVFIVRLLALALAVTSLTACRSTYYSAMEQFGVHKRDILVDRVEEGRNDQEEAKEAFQSALDRFAAVVDVEGGTLQDKYEELNDQLETCESRALAVSDRIVSIETVASDLFDEWEAELDEYTSADLRTRSEQTLRQTRDRYDQLIGAMHRAEERMPPILSAFNDQVLFLKHNLNAQAIASLQGDVAALEGEISSLIAEMNNAIAEANAFISEMGGT